MASTHPPPPLDLLVEVVAETTLTRLVNTAATVILVYDYILTFDDEIRVIWNNTPWGGLKVLWIGHRYLNLVNFLVIPMIQDAGLSCTLYSWFPLLEAITSQFFISVILTLRCWALFGGSRTVLGGLVGIYVCCLVLQIYPAIITFNLPLGQLPGIPNGLSNTGIPFVACFVGSYIAMTNKSIAPWRIAGWVGGVVFDGAIMALTAFRAIRLRMSGHRISIVESMLQDGIFYFVIVFGLNISLLITFVTVHCAIQLIFQRLTQVLTVVMVSRMCLSLKMNSRTQKRNESNDMAFGSLVHGENTYQEPAPLDTWVIASGKVSSGVGTLGNDLVHTSLLDY